MSEIKIFYREDNQIYVKEDIIWAVTNADKILWVDMEKPDEETKSLLEEKFNIDIRTEKEIVEIETSSRYIEN
ncbi:MAG TPA: magnesium and cobalt transport protein CorA, partial [Bacteroidales bacterium]|nr:magnesium and cobalt transport protein CorA [Bacteroidales bacterium]